MEAYPTDSLADQVSRLETRAWIDYPATFAGLWIEDGNHAGGIYVAFSKSPEQSLQRLADLQDFSRPDLLIPLDVKYSVSELENIQASMVSDREAIALTGALTYPWVDSDFSVSVDIPNNRVEVTTENADHIREDVKHAFGADVKVTQGDPGDPHCLSRWQCGYQLRGAIGIHNQPVGETYYLDCSTAFSVSYGAYNQILSAAHCGDDPDTGYGDVGYKRWHGSGTPGNLFGYVKDQFQGGRADAERISVGGSFYAWPVVYRDHLNISWSVDSVGTWAGATIGDTYCKSAEETGRTCGELLDKTFSPNYIPGGERFLRVDQYAAGGDSGGSLYRGHQAVGILSGGSPSLGAFHGHIQYAENALNVSVDT